MKEDMKDLGRYFWRMMVAASMISIMLFWLSWIFFRLIMATEDAFSSTDFFTSLRVLVLAGWVSALFFLYSLHGTLVFMRKKALVLEKDD